MTTGQRNQFGENECDPSKALKCEQLSIDDDEYSTVGFWHIHPDGTDFSDNDRGWIKRQNKGNLPFYLIDKYGQVRKLIPVEISSPSLKDPYLTYIGISVNSHDPRE